MLSAIVRKAKMMTAICRPWFSLLAMGGPLLERLLVDGRAGSGPSGQSVPQPWIGYATGRRVTDASVAERPVTGRLSPGKAAKASKKRPWAFNAAVQSF